MTTTNKLMAIKIVKEKTHKRKKKPYYLLVYNYMIGDADGYTTEEVEVSIDNPYLERYCKLLNKLKPNKGYWGLSLDEENIEKCHNEKQINKEEYDFLMATMFENEEMYDGDGAKSEFFEGVRSDTEYSFLVFENVELFYFDENGKKHKTKIK
jgi:hypothetical protein